MAEIVGLKKDDSFEKSLRDLLEQFLRITGVKGAVISSEDGFVMDAVTLHGEQEVKTELVGELLMELNH